MTISSSTWKKIEQSGQWDSNYVCPAVKDFECDADNTFMCPSGYYPVCGDVPGKGYKTIKVNALKECTDLCDNYKKCVGAEYFFKKGNNNEPEGKCYLNNEYATTANDNEGMHACYKYGATCPTKKINVAEDEVKKLSVKKPEPKVPEIAICDGWAKFEKNGKWDGRYVCPHTQKYRCKEANYKCPAGYYPVCGAHKGLGIERSHTKTLEECAKRCTNYNNMCNGFQFILNSSGLFNKMCILNAKYPNKSQEPGQVSCYRYGAKCEGYNIKLPEEFMPKVAKPSETPQVTTKP